MYAILPYYISNLIITIPIEVLPVLASADVTYFMANLGRSFLMFALIIFLENLAGVSIGMALSACFKSVTMAPQIAPAAVILFLIFNGSLINEDSIPVYFLWLREISFIRYAFKGAMLNEFHDVTFTCEGIGPNEPCITSGNTVLSQFEFDDESATKAQSMCLVALVGLAAGFNVLAFLILVLRRPRFLPLNAAEDGANKVAPSTTANGTQDEPNVVDDKSAANKIDTEPEVNV